MVGGQWSMVNGQVYKNASEPDKMWGYYCYREVPIKGVEIDPNVYRETDTKWYDARTNESVMSSMPTVQGMILAYHYRIPNGHVKADVVWKNKYAKMAKVKVRVVHPHSGQVLYNGEFGNTDLASTERTDVLFPDINFPTDDFYRIELRCDDWGALQSINYFNYYRESDLPVSIRPLLDKALATDPARRHPSAAAFDAEVSALKAFAAKGGVIVSDVETGMMDEFFVAREKSPLAGIVGRMPDVADDNAVQAFLSANGIAANPESIEGLSGGRSVFRVREAGGCRIVGFKSTSKALGSRVTVRLGRKCRVYEVGKGLVGDTDKVEIASLDVPFKLYAAFDGEPDFFRNGAVYRREVIAPGGMPVAHREKVFAYDGSLPPYRPALNDAAGEWSLRYVDIATGRERLFPVDKKY